MLLIPFPHGDVVEERYLLYFKSNRMGFKGIKWRFRYDSLLFVGHS